MHEVIFIFGNIGHVFCSLSSWCKCIYRYLQKELSYPTLWRSKSLWKSISRRRWRSICSGTLKLTLSPRISWIFHPLVFTLKNLHNWTRGGTRRYFHGGGWTIVYTIGKGIMDKHRLEWFARKKKHHSRSCRSRLHLLRPKPVCADIWTSIV